MATTPSRPPTHPNKRRSQSSSIVVAPTGGRRSRMGSIYEALSMSRRSTIFNAFSSLNAAVADLNDYLGEDSASNFQKDCGSITFEIECLEYFQQELHDDVESIPHILSDKHQVKNSATSEIMETGSVTSKELEQQPVSTSNTEPTQHLDRTEVVAHRSSPKQVWSKWMAFTNQAFTRIELAVVTIGMWCIPLYR